MYLYNENVLEYAQIAQSGPKSMIRDTEGLSSIVFCNPDRNNLIFCT